MTRVKMKHALLLIILPPDRTRDVTCHGGVRLSVTSLWRLFTEQSIVGPNSHNSALASDCSM